ncbi:hypothetical protein [Streptomyces sp. NPDC049879]|uniref:hypothetical protein n=1 Tax=Streptomyces sp. NPDC049879 TaxID=3365598 RepID=UPI00378B4986
MAVRAMAAGMHTALIRRGPWGTIQRHDPATERATMRIDSLLELLGSVVRFRAC